MGIGDELMCAGEARRRAGGDPQRKFLMRDRDLRPKWHWVWEHCAHVARPGQRYYGTVDYGGNGKRVYVLEEGATRRQFNEYAPVPAALTVPAPAAERGRQFAGFVAFNPSIKHRASPGKRWPLLRWKALTSAGRAYQWVEIGDASAGRFHNAVFYRTGHFWDACGVLANVRALVTHEGALHHAAAALGIPCVVIRGGYISPRVTGYAGQADLYVEDERYPLGCGMKIGCVHCEAAMDAITTAAVLEALAKVLPEERRS